MSSSQLRRGCEGTSFDAVARDIVQKSISSAVCVDNTFAEPYSDEKAEFDEETPRRLYESFRKHGCALDVYRYVDMPQWKVDKNHILRNRDLLILDWELVGDPPFRDALQILWEAVDLPSLPFVVIYTHQIDTSLVELNVLSYFGPSFESLSERKKKFDQYCDFLDDEMDIDDARRMFGNVSEECREYALKRPDQENIKRGLFTLMQEHCEEEDLKKLLGRMVSAGRDILGISDFDTLIEFVGFHLGNAMVNTRDSPMDVLRVEGARHSFLINNTMVTILVKPKAAKADGEVVISPEEVYSRFARNVYKRPRNFLALLALEMKSLYRENVGLIGSELYDIEEAAFFHHQKGLESEDDFYDFLRTCWKNQLSAFNMLQNPELFSVLEEYKNREKYEEIIEKWKKENLDQFMDELAKLNYHFSFLQIKRKENDRMRFGDVFVLSKDSQGKEPLGFVLCITPHCDCLHRDNIKHKFHFVLGNREPLRDGLAFSEKKLYSFIVYDNSPMCVRWNRKPFTLHVPDKHNNISRSIHVLYHRKDRYLNHVACQKENYSQRIAYEAFSHASRVGVELAKLELEEELERKPNGARKGDSPKNP